METTLSRTVVVSNRQGLHLRPADMFIKLARRFDAKVEVVKDTLRVDGKSILDITLLAATKGTELIIEATGHDAEAALDALADLIQNRLLEIEYLNDQEELAE